MASDSRAIEVRRATVDDYQAVLNINDNVYQGLDYIPYSYHDLVTDPDFSYYVCLVDGEVAAFEGVCLLDDNRSLMTRSARVKDKFQGQGLIAHIKKKIYEDYKDIPGQKNLRMACTNKVHYVHSKTFRSLNKVLLVERLIQFAEVEVRKMKALVAVSDKTKEISMEDLSHLFQTECVKNYLFPQNLITDDSWFFDTVPSNIRHIGKRSTQLVITEHLYRFLPQAQLIETATTNQLGEPPIPTNWHAKGHNCKNDCCTQGLLALVNHYFSPVNNLFGINIFGRPVEGKEVEEIGWIIQSSVNILQTLYLDQINTQPTVVFVVINNKDIPTQMFYEASKPFGLLPTQWKEQFTEQWYFEQGFDCLLN